MSILETVPEEERLRTACFSGHRSVRVDNADEKLLGTLDSAIAAAVSMGYRIFYSGGAVGFDTLAGFRIGLFKKRMPDVELRLRLPYRNHTEKWKIDEISKYKKLLAYVDKVEYTYETYNDGCMLERDRDLVAKSSLCIAYLTKIRGGTVYTVNCARRAGIGVINIATGKIDGNAFSKYSDSLSDKL